MLATRTCVGYGEYISRSSTARFPSMAANCIPSAPSSMEPFTWIEAAFSRVVAREGRELSARLGGDWCGPGRPAHAGHEGAPDWERVVPRLVGGAHHGIVGDRLKPRLSGAERSREDEARGQDLGGPGRGI
eukprot:scaffold205339_cov26-Tisochrysis_lutea.AAC.1